MRRRGVVLVVVLAAFAALMTLAACTSSDHAAGHRVTSPALPSDGTPAGSDSPTSTSPSPSGSEVPTSPVHASLLEGDGQTYGVGMPIIMRFSVPVTDPAALDAHAKVTVNGRPAGGSWYWFTPTEAHYRPPGYWPAYAQIALSAPLKDKSAGEGLAYDNNLTLDMFTGAAVISTVDAQALTMTVQSDGAVVRTVPVSLGKAATPTFGGVKVIMEKDAIQRMVGPGYDEQVPWSLRITNSGEFVHAAPWNSQIGQVSTSNGCTNLSTDDAKWMFEYSHIGDVVLYPNASGGTMPSWDGYGDWNLDWATWLAGGAL